MEQLVSFLDAHTMVFLAAVLFFSMTAILAYTYFYRKTYSGFGFFTLGQLFWCLGIFLVFFRVLGPDLSLLLGNGLIFLQGVLWYRGIALYGEVDHIGLRNSFTIALAVLGELCIFYYIFVDFDTCRRVTVFSVYCSLVYGRIALEPFLIRKWRTYSMQAVFSWLLFIVALVYAYRSYASFSAVHCDLGGPDPIIKTLLLTSMFFIPLLTFSLLSMTSGRVEAELRETQEALRRQAQTDFLTGISNRRHFLHQAEQTLRQAGERGEPVSLLMLDLDFFKDINDTYGHQAGDAVLRAVSRRLGEVLRPIDVIGRLGGEEFGVILPGLELKEAVAVADRLRAAVAALRPGGHAVTASLGVASGVTALNDLLARADACLYAAKDAGRNRVVCSDCLGALKQETTT
jgi:diguanylate cyclase (GGDEF)-like protein